MVEPLQPTQAARLFSIYKIFFMLLMLKKKKKQNTKVNNFFKKKKTFSSSFSPPSTFLTYSSLRSPQSPEQRIRYWVPEPLTGSEALKPDVALTLCSRQTSVCTEIPRPTGKVGVFHVPLQAARISVHTQWSLQGGVKGHFGQNLNAHPWTSVAVFALGTLSDPQSCRGGQ